ncbi:hypothetical protein D3C72_1739220 [compost metagenome]
MLCKCLRIMRIKVVRALSCYFVENWYIANDSRYAKGKCLGDWNTVAFIETGGDEEGVLGKEAGVVRVADTVMEDDICIF